MLKVFRLGKILIKLHYGFMSTFTFELRLQGKGDANYCFIKILKFVVNFSPRSGKIKLISKGDKLG